MSEMQMLNNASFIHQQIQEDLKGNLQNIKTRFPPEPNGYLHIGHAKSICLNFGLAKMYSGTCHLRFDDTNPEKEEEEYVRSIMEDVKWLGFDWEDRLFFASDYFDQYYEWACLLIKKGKAYVCDLSLKEIKEYRGSLKQAGKNSPFRDRTVEENLTLFEEMKQGKYPDGSRTLRAKIDMSSPNMNLRDPVLYRISHTTHHNTQDKWCIYPMYDYAHPLEDAIEGITHSICTLEFEDHRPLYDWVIKEIGFEKPPRQIEFARLNITNTVMSKRHLKKIVDEKLVSAWNDPRMPTISGLRKRGFTPQSIRNFCEMIGVSKANSVVDYGMLEFCIREDLKKKVQVLMGIVDPLKITIHNYPHEQIEFLEVKNNPENPEAGYRQVAFTKEIYIEREDFMEFPENKFRRLSPGVEVRLVGAYFIKCEEVIKDENGQIIELICSYDPQTKSGSGFSERKAKATIHWVSASIHTPVTIRQYDFLFQENEFGVSIFNPNSIQEYHHAFVEKSIDNFEKGTHFQLMRNGYYYLDPEDSTEKPHLNRICSLKSSYKPPK